MSQPIGPAAFGRLCVETDCLCSVGHFVLYQPPSGGCVLKQPKNSTICCKIVQPPSGGCVLKLVVLVMLLSTLLPAAFGRLCVETPMLLMNIIKNIQPPSGGCVLKL